MRRPSIRRLHALLALFAGLAAGGCAAPGERAVTAYVGAFSDHSLPDEILLAKPLTTEESYMGAVAYSEPFIEVPGAGARWEWEVQGVKHWGIQDHYELNALLVMRLMRLPWNHVVRTSFAFGEGLSWASEVPEIEESSRENDGATQLLNYLLLEATFGAPAWENLDFVFRIHHRSGIFGLFDDVNGGSNVLAVGLKYRF